MKILALDSSGPSLSVAVSDDNLILSEFFLNTGLTHTQNLAPAVDYVISSSVRDPKNLDLLAVSIGPGSFTGIKIGLAFIKGMALALGLPCVGVSSCEALAWQAQKKCLVHDSVICSVISSRELEIYCAFFEFNLDKINRISDDSYILMCDFYEKIKKIKKKVVIIGNLSDLCYKYAQDWKINVSRAFIRASDISNVFYLNNKPDSGENLCANYLKLSKAEYQLLNGDFKKT
ncbi:MAG: tRNA (adenosine(37)-N6)-threonylcarbamoyltransferase complex dimerization subunit type 1 TsaB [Candidatus Improbicoccus devescovinae]|nr:MAG: tRNA (adenosine(37)-N6)-threonylcarbamoyltransferase complex dimerization subunit type 1 TsaB [Candidatus Improbicoccus devescovinae]